MALSKTYYILKNQNFRNSQNYILWGIVKDKTLSNMANTNDEFLNLDYWKIYIKDLKMSNTFYSIKIVFKVIMIIFSLFMIITLGSILSHISSFEIFIFKFILFIFFIQSLSNFIGERWLRIIRFLLIMRLFIISKINYFTLNYIFIYKLSQK